MVSYHSSQHIAAHINLLCVSVYLPYIWVYQNNTTMRTKHTSGLWLESGNPPHMHPETKMWKAGVISDSGPMTAIAFGRTKEEALANQKVISKVPEMIKALELLLEITEPEIVNGRVGIYTTHVIQGKSLSQAIEAAIKTLDGISDIAKATD